MALRAIGFYKLLVQQFESSRHILQSNSEKIKKIDKNINMTFIYQSRKETERKWILLQGDVLILYIYMEKILKPIETIC